MARSASQPHSFGRRSFLRGAAHVGLTAAAAPALSLLGGAAPASNARHVVGCIKPRPESNSLAELAKLLPTDISLIPRYLNFAYGTREELSNAIPNYESHIAYLTTQRCDLISIEGAPPFMLIGPQAERRMGRRLEAEIRNRHVHFGAEPGECAERDQRHTNSRNHVVRGRSQSKLCKIF
jgi:hypothetical protein